MELRPRWTYVDGDDWCGLYCDGELRAEGHSLRPYDIFIALGIVLDHKYASLPWLTEVGRLPAKLADVKLEGDEFEQ